MNLTVAREFVSEWLSRESISITARGALKCPRGRSYDTILGACLLDYETLVSSNHHEQRRFISSERKAVKALPDASIRRALENAIDEAKLEARASLVASLTNQPEDLTELRRFSKAVRGYHDDYTVGLWAHFLQNVKLKMLDRPTSNELCPVLYGRQGSGKSRAVHGLLSPLDGFTIESDMARVSDERQYQSLADNFVVFMDEMAKSDRVSIESVKHIITARELTYRRFHGHQNLVVANRASFIGASNQPVAEVILDRTGQRRWAQVDTADQIDWKTVNEINYPALWAGISEDVDYFIGIRARLSAAQAEATTQDEFAMFVEDHTLVASDGKDARMVFAQDLYADFSVWAAERNFKNHDARLFGRRMNSLGLNSFKTTHKGRNGAFYRLAPLVSRSISLVAAGLDM